MKWSAWTSVAPTRRFLLRRATKRHTSRRSHEGEAPELLAGYLERIGRGELLTKEEELALARQARAGDKDAYQQRLVVSVAKRYRELGSPFEDQIQESNFGSIKYKEVN